MRRAYGEFVPHMFTRVGMFVPAIMPNNGRAPRCNLKLRSDRSKCSSFGFKPGTDGFANCIMQQELTRESARSVRREMEKAAECADLKGTYTKGAAAGILKGFALAMNDSD